MEMGLELLCSILAVVGATCVFLFGFLKNINEWYYVTRLGKKKNTLPPGDMGWPFIGHICSFFKAFNSQDPDTFIENLIKRYGKTGIYKTHLFGSPSIIVCSPELCRKALADEHVLFGYPSSARQLAGKKSLYGISASEHRRLRKIAMNPINGDEALASHIELIEGIVTTSLEDLASMKGPANFFYEMRKITFKVIAHIVLGSTQESVLSSLVKCYSDLFPGIVSMPVNIPGFVFHRALKARNMLLKIFKEKVAERRAKSTEPDSKKEMIDSFMEAEYDNGKKLDDEHLMDLLLIFLFAGHETAAHTAMWATIYLHHHPEMLQKAKEEQQEIIKRRPASQKGLTLTEIKQMDYLPKVIDESMRRANFAFTLFRKVETDVNLNGYTIPKGWKVLVWSRAVHMDPTIYPNPKEFLPSRWENPGLKGKNFIPFGGGSRICPGSELGKLEVSIFLHYFLLNYKLEELNTNVPTITLPLTRPADNCLARIIRLP
ncbi:ARABIDOPSIS ENT-KAURENOIC ACID HYDROXYLASE 2, ent-kaurenoic acid hydroxylase 2 [Hibiscus trionum]|uniref:ARABIDOPSIS ENT-KAURENOIC ACID HYDROXYLASE 2, ent-kaurenoic acid hydroxylase 2 n=1 Tax=Hibiscus trionum TaxID=183268 RepID=A0A9W7MUV1_HIBTR|nr:ARABIDOPSIS ENT-KAURENOIC ACID HYDROXYLASE 2, ent-kaurenoic acid hydroxylase 2 [Hibiscus trionum]